MSKALLAAAQGLAIAALVHAGVTALRAERPAPLLDERAGRIHEVAVHYVPSADFAGAICLDFLRRLSADARVYVAVEKAEHADEFGRLAGRDVVPVVIGCPITPWSRDRFAAGEDGVVVIPPEAHPGGTARRNDRLVPFVLARVAGSGERVAPFRFDGGDFLAVGGRVIATSTWTGRTPERPPADLVLEAERLFGQPVVYLPDAPEHHVGMIVAPVGSDTVLVGDVRWGRRLAPATLDADDSDETARRFDAAAEALARAGFRVERIPAVPTKRDFAWITYTNGIFEPGVVYLPVYGLRELDAAAAGVYSRLGFDVRAVDVSRAYELGGTLHCLVHVLRRA